MTAVQPLINFLIRWWKYILAGVITGLVLIPVIVLAISGVAFLADKAEIEQSLEDYQAWLRGEGEIPQNPYIEIYASDGSIIGEFPPERGSRISLSQCQDQVEWLRKAAVSAEDRDFYNHSGVSFRGIARAMKRNLLSMSIREGAGTISQQLIRNLYTDRSSTLHRKIYETYGALLLERIMSKEEILCLYLNKIYMGEGRLGAEEASWFYFRKPPARLDVAEAAMIVGLFPSPVRYSPLNNIEFSLIKQRIVLQALARDGKIDESQIDQLIDQFKERYNIQETEDSLHAGNIGAYGASRDFRLNRAPSANEYVRQFLFENIPEDIVRQGGLKVYTTIDPLKQAASLEAVRTGIARVRQQMLENETVDPADMRLLVRRLNGVLISIDPDTGGIRAVVGGYAITEGGTMTQRIWDMKRQPGSALKGFLYAVAIDEGTIDVDSIVNDEVVDFDGYSPRNWYRNYRGEMTIRQAIALSVNTVAVKTLEDFGVDRFRQRMAQALNLGYSESRQRFSGSLSLALGTGELSPVELARLYAMLLNQGRHVRPYLIDRVEDPNGTVIWEYSYRSYGRSVVSPDACAKTIHLLESVVDEQEEGTAGWIGRRRNQDPSFLPFPIAGKSGTVQSVARTRERFPGMPGVRDAWFVGLVPGETTVVWVGHDEGAPFPGGGSSTAGSIWAEYARIAYRDGINRAFPDIEQEYLEEEDVEYEPTPFIHPEDTNPFGDPSQIPDEYQRSEYDSRFDY